jgi:hypothetical protein
MKPEPQQESYGAKNAYAHQMLHADSNRPSLRLRQFYAGCHWSNIPISLNDQQSMRVIACSQHLFQNPRSLWGRVDVLVDYVAAGIEADRVVFGNQWCE